MTDSPRGENKSENANSLKLCCIEQGRNTIYFGVEFLCFVLFIICAVMASSIGWRQYSWRFYVFGAALTLFCLIGAELNRRHKFKYVTAWCYTWRYPIVVSFLLLAFIDLIILRLSDVPSDCTCEWYYDWDADCSDVTDDTTSGCPPLNPDENGIRYITRSMTILSGVLFVGCILGYWEQASYTAATNDWIIACLYMTVIGYIFLYFSRSLVPPKKDTKQDNWSWHQEHDENKVLSKIVVLSIVLNLFFVVMGAIVLAIFGDAASATGSLGTVGGVIIFSLIAFIIMITPLAPGSIVDVAAGFLFVTMFVEIEGMDVPEAFFLALAITIVLHFIGSCLQYWVGKIRAVQIWGNKELPPQLLAASDSVLKTANWAKVGIVGQVFMDTANGLNQGRMNMDFCTQFWSEYASIPNAISLVLLGTVLAIQGFSDSIASKYEWADEAIPLVIMIAWLWQMMGSSWGFKELLQSIHTVSYWTALEKWETVQHFARMGYFPTSKGWEDDVYELAKGKDGRDPLFLKVQELHPPEVHRTVTKESAMHYCKKLLHRPKDAEKQRNKMIDAIKLDRRRSEIRKAHWQGIESQFEQYVKDEFLSKVEKEEPTESYFSHASGNAMYLHYLIVFAIYVTFLGSYYYIARGISLSDAVKEGISVLDSVSGTGWAFFVVFWILVFIYFWRSFLNGLLSFGSGIKFVFGGMKVDPSWETVFNTPKWTKESSNNEKENENENNENGNGNGNENETQVVVADPAASEANSPDQNSSEAALVGDN